MCEIGLVLLCKILFDSVKYEFIVEPVWGPPSPPQKKTVFGFLYFIVSVSTWRGLSCWPQAIHEVCVCVMGELHLPGGQVKALLRVLDTNVNQKKKKDQWEVWFLLGSLDIVE